MLSAALLILAMTPGVNDPIMRDGFDADLCPAGRQTRANLSVGGFTLTNADVTQWANVWGIANVWDAPVPWPGLPYSMPIILNFSETGYLALEFHVPPDVPTNRVGWLTHTEYNYGKDLTVAISTECGDFHPPSQACHAETVSGQNLGPWRVNTNGGFCLLSPDTNYFLNLKITDPEQSSSSCAPLAPSCAIGTANNFY
jgi:hypothetical protein